MFNVDNLPAQFMPAREGGNIVEQQNARHLTVDNTADFWQADPDPDLNGNENDDKADESMETSSAHPQASQVINGSGSDTSGPGVVGSVEQNLARLAIVTTSSA
jgi:hypothetical protein